MDVHLRKLAADQDDLVAVWQLVERGWRGRSVEHHAAARSWRRVHDGVYCLAQAPLTRRQRWVAAVLSAPGTFLAERSAAACWGFHDWDGPYETVVRAGSGGRRRHGALVVARSLALRGQTTRHLGIPVVSAPRALVDLAARLGPYALARAFRESIRLETTTAEEIARTLSGQRGTRLLRDLCDRYAAIPYHRCRSDAESRALEVLHDAGVEPPLVNVRVAGREADLVWRRRRLIVEVDGQRFHRFADQDELREALWRRAGYVVRRIRSDDVYFQPERLLALVNVHRHPL